MKAALTAFVAGAALVIAGFLLALSIPVFAASLKLLPGEYALELVESGETPSKQGLMRAVASQVSSLESLSRPLPHLNTAVLAFAFAEAPGTAPAQQDEMLAAARHHLERSLAMAPAQARAWLMLAGLDLHDNDQAAAARALTLSFTADPHSPVLATARWPLVFELDDRLDRAIREQAHLEFLAYFRRNDDDALRLALRLDRLGELRALVSDVPFDTELLQRLQQEMRYGGPSR